MKMVKGFGAVFLVLAVTAGPAAAQPQVVQPPAGAPPQTVCPLPGQGGMVCPPPAQAGMVCPLMLQLQQKIDALAKEGGIKPDAQRELSDLLGQMQALCRQMCPLLKQPPAAAPAEPGKY